MHREIVEPPSDTAQTERAGYADSRLHPLSVAGGTHRGSDGRRGAVDLIGRRDGTGSEYGLGDE